MSEDNNKATFAFSIDVPVRGEWANVDLLRTSVQNCFTAVFSDVDGCHALSMVTAELLENAVKYGSWGAHGEQAFRLRVIGHPNRALVSVENPIEADDPKVTELLETLEWMKGFDSPADAYRSKLLSIADTSERPMGLSKLGIVRVAYEGSCNIHAAVNDERLTVTAELALE